MSFSRKAIYGSIIAGSVIVFCFILLLISFNAFSPSVYQNTRGERTYSRRQFFDQVQNIQIGYSRGMVHEQMKYFTSLSESSDCDLFSATPDEADRFVIWGNRMLFIRICYSESERVISLSSWDG